MSTAIKISNLSKIYRLGEIGTGTISRDLERWYKMKIKGQDDPFLKIGERNDRSIKGENDIVYSLRDINLEIKKGGTLGIIGRNGAGKSTLLKILSRVTSPSTGEIGIKGRVASLLEVGTGFHPELTGRENIYLNGAILGMKKKEIDSKLDEIIDFSGNERFIDTPVKRYSSGMYVRLAFAVAAHLESEILIVDEVLAVGDAEFQKKCIGKMNEVSNIDGRTILFVSHNLAAVNQLCQESLLLSNGQIEMHGKTDDVISQYLRVQGNSDEIVNLLNHRINRRGNKKVEFQQLWLKRENSKDFNRLFSIGNNINIGFKIKFINPNERKVKTAVEIKTADGFKIANMIDVDSNFQVEYLDNNIVEYSINLNDIRLYPGTYYLSLFAGDMSSDEIYDYVEDCISFEILDGGNLTTRHLPQSAGLLFLTPQWEKIS